MAGLIILYT